MNTGLPESEIFRIGQNKIKEKAGTAEAIYYIEETALRKMQLLKGTGNLEAAGGEKERGAGQKL